MALAADGRGLVHMSAESATLSSVRAGAVSSSIARNSGES